MKKATVIKEVEKRCRRLHRHHRNLLEEFGVEAIHDFRVEIKKLRAFLRLLNGGDETQKTTLRISRPLRLFYRTVGAVRCLQLQQKMVGEWCGELACELPVAYLALLRQKEAEAKAAVRQAALHFSFPRFRQNLLKAVQQKSDETAAAEFLATIKCRLLLYLPAAVVVADEDLHELRKRLKDLLYVWPFLLSFLPSVFPTDVLSRERCLQLTEKLGGFQDISVALLFFEPAYLDTVAEAERAVLQRLKQYCAQKKEELKAGILQELTLLREAWQQKEQLSGIQNCQ